MLPRFHPDCQQLLEQISDAFVALDREWRYAYVNRRAGALFGREPEDLIGKHIWTEFPEGVGQPFHAAYERAMREQVPLTLEEYYAPWDRWFENRIHPSPEGLLIFFQEITERKRVEQELRLAHAQMAALFDAIPDRVWMKDREGHYLNVNEAYAAAYGRRREEVLGRTDHEIFPREVADEYRAVDGEVMERRCRSTLAPYPWVQDGETTWWETIKAPFLDTRGEVAGTVGVARDITEHRRTIEALRASETQLHLLLEHFPGVLWTTDPALTITTCRGALTAEWGDRLVGMPLSKLLSADSPATRQHYRALEGVGGEYEVTIAGRAFQAQVAPLSDATGQVSGTIGVAVDINERSEMEALLRESEERFRQLAEHVREVFWVHGPELAEMTYISPAYEEVWGRSCESLYRDPLSFLEAIHPEDRPRVEAALPRQAGGGYDERYRVVRPDGSVRWVRDRAFPIHGADGRVHRLVGVAEDVTEAVLAHQALERREAYYRSLIENAQDLITVLDADGTIRYESPALLRLLGTAPEQVVGRSIHDFIHRDDRPQLDAALRRAMTEPERCFTVELRFPHVDGSWRTLETTGRSLLEDPNVRGVVVNSRDVTERVEAERRLRESEERYRLVGRVSNDVIWELDPRRGQSLWGESMASVFGYAPEAAGLDEAWWVARLHPEDRERVMRSWRGAIAGVAERWDEEYRFLRADGSYALVQDRALVQRDAAGAAVRLVGAMRDVTRQRATELELRALFGAMQDLVLVMDAEGRYLRVAPTRPELLVRPAEEGLGRTVHEVLPPETAARGLEVIRQVLRTGQPRSLEYPLPLAGGQKWFDATVTPLNRETVLWVVRDITERKHAEAALSESEERFRQLVELSPDAILVHSEGTIRFVNSTTLRLLGAGAPEQLVGTPVFDIVAADDRPASVERVESMYRSNQPAPARELVLRRLDDSLVPVEITAAPVPFQGGTAIQVIIRDLSERQAAEAALRESEERFRQLAENLQHVFWMVDAEMRRMLYASPAYERIWGEPVERLYEDARHWMRWIHPDDAERVGTLLRQVPASTGVEIDFRIQRGDGELRWLRARAFPVRNEHGEPYRVAGITEDITDARIREQQLRRAERLAGLGTLVGGVAHELNNPLTAVKSFAQLMLVDARDPADQEALEIIEREAGRAASIVSNLRLLARQTQVEQGARQRVDLNEVVRHVLKLRRYSLSTGGVEVREELAEGLPALWADRGEIEQVVINLLLNAEQALARHAGRRALVLRTTDGAGRITLEVADSGPGIRAEHLGRIFDPFFTTKEPGEGTGLGLSLVHGIVAEHGGHIHAESEQGRGARFIVEFPRVEAVEAAPISPLAAATPARRKLRVLLVDDEEAIRRAVGRLLRRRGHQVDEAAGGEDALLRLQRTRYDVVLSDLRMPGLGGDNFLMALQQFDPSLPQRLVLMTGDSADQQSVAVFRAAGVPVLLKPFDLDETVRVVEQRAEP